MTKGRERDGFVLLLVLVQPFAILPKNLFNSLKNKKLPFQDYSTNIFLKDSAFDLSYNPVKSETGFKMTLVGILYKVAILILLTLFSAIISWEFYDSWLNIQTHFVAVFFLSFWFSLFVGFFAFFFKSKTKYIAPFSAFFLGFTLGTLSAQINSLVPGVIALAVILSFSVLIGSCSIYIIQPRKRIDVFWVAFFGVIFGIATLYLTVLVLNMYDFNIHYPHELSIFTFIPLCIVLFGSIITMLASLEFVVYQIQQDRPYELEWYSAFALYISVVWLYLDILYYLTQKKE